MVRFFLILLLGLLFSCKGEKTNEQDICTLISTGSIKSFELDSDVKYNAFYLYTFSDLEKMISLKEDWKEYKNKPLKIV